MGSSKEGKKYKHEKILEYCICGGSFGVGSSNHMM